MQGIVPDPGRKVKAGLGLVSPIISDVLSEERLTRDDGVVRETQTVYAPLGNREQATEGTAVLPGIR